MAAHDASGRRQANTRTREVLGPMQPNERLEKPPRAVRVEPDPVVRDVEDTLSLRRLGCTERYPWLGGLAGVFPCVIEEVL